MFGAKTKDLSRDFKKGRKTVEMKRYKIIGCEILHRELCHCASVCNAVVDMEFLEKKLHDIGAEKMSNRIQEAIDQVDTNKYDAILLGYGLCNYGLVGVKSKIPMVIPRSHDCIALLMGSKEKYEEHMMKKSGSYYLSTGWMERDTDPKLNSQSVTASLGMNSTYEEYVKQYGEENAKFLMESLGEWTNNYSRFTYIASDFADFDQHLAVAKEQAKEKQWEFEELKGDSNILLRLLNGQWDDEDFMVIPPGETIKASFDDRIMSL